MSEPEIAGKASIPTELEAGRDYFWCKCGRSTNQPFCDGSHKSTEFTPLKFQVDEDQTRNLCACKRSGNKPFCDGTHNTL